MSSAWRRSPSRASLLLEGDPSCGDNDACESCSNSNDACKVWRHAATSAKAEQMFTMSGESMSSTSQRIARDRILGGMLSGIFGNVREGHDGLDERGEKLTEGHYKPQGRRGNVTLHLAFHRVMALVVEAENTYVHSGKTCRCHTR